MELYQSWKNELKNTVFRWYTLVSFALLFILLNFFAKFLTWNEKRVGVQLRDPVLELFPAQDHSKVTFALIYIAVLVAIVHVLHHPKRLMWGVNAYTLMLALRGVTIYILPIEAPEGIIPLVDHVVETIASSNTLLKDLFFSGHTSTMFLLFLASYKKIFKITFFIGTFAVGGLVLLQHVHYTFDVVAAPFFSYGCFRIARLILENFVYKSKFTH